jgi:glycerate-2-kinase
VRWLVVVDSSILTAGNSLPAVLKKLLAKASARLAPFSDPVPLSGGETSIEVEGPEDLPGRLETATVIKGVYPSSDLTLY